MIWGIIKLVKTSTVATIWIPRSAKKCLFAVPKQNPNNIKNKEKKNSRRQKVLNLDILSYTAIYIYIYIYSYTT